MFTPKIKDWRDTTNTDGSVINTKAMTPHHFMVQVFANREGTLIHPPNTCNCTSNPMAVDLEILSTSRTSRYLVALQKGQPDIASDSASCLSQISKQTLNPMRMRNRLHAELIQAVSDLLEHSPHPIHFYKVKAHSDIIGNEGADPCARTAALSDTIDIALPDARDPFHNLYWLSLKTSCAQND
eukprot:188084-Pelagomonas_calceolata.AAC.1